MLNEDKIASKLKTVVSETRKLIVGLGETMLKIMTNLRDYKFLGRLLSEILCDLHIHSHSRVVLVFECGCHLHIR